MVRQLRQKQMPTKKEAYPYPTRYGSHSSMVDEDKTEELSEDGAVVLKDEHGYYKTYANRIDTGLADPKRYGTSRLSWFKKNS
jgi:hypothetical protein